MTDYLYLCCPHCNILIEISQINCGIFRHGTYKKDHTQIDPHLPKDKCEELVEKGLIYGCGKPFRYNGTSLEVCEYI